MRDDSQIRRQEVGLNRRARSALNLMRQVSPPKNSGRENGVTRDKKKDDDRSGKYAVIRPKCRDSFLYQQFRRNLCVIDFKKKNLLSSFCEKPFFTV